MASSSTSSKPQSHVGNEQARRSSKGKNKVSSTGEAEGSAADMSRPCKEHSFITDLSDVRQMEQGLLTLLDDFHSGKLRAFGENCTFEKMDAVRQKQEQLARLHFDLDAEHDLHGMDTMDGNRKSNENMNKLMCQLQDLSSSIQRLYPNEDASHAQAGVSGANTGNQT